MSFSNPNKDGEEQNMNNQQKEEFQNGKGTAKADVKRNTARIEETKRELVESRNHFETMIEEVREENEELREANEELREAIGHLIGAFHWADKELAQVGSATSTWANSHEPESIVERANLKEVTPEGTTLVRRGEELPDFVTEPGDDAR